MLRYKVTSDRYRVVDGLGVFEKDETREFSADEAGSFLRIRGVPLNASNVPEGVKVEILVDRESEEG